MSSILIFGGIYLFTKGLEPPVILAGGISNAATTTSGLTPTPTPSGYEFSVQLPIILNKISIGGSSFQPFGKVNVSLAFELTGQGTNIDSIAIWEAPNPVDTLMFVTAKSNNLIEVWEYPFQGNELSPLVPPSKPNGVAVDQDADTLHVAESGNQQVTVFSLPNLQQLYQYGKGILGTGENNIALLQHSGGITWAYVTDDHTVYAFNADSGVPLNIQISPPVTSIETVVADGFHQIIYVPEEQGIAGTQDYMQITLMEPLI